MYDVTALGELLIDFTPSGTSVSGQRLFEQNPGGAPANVLAALNNCGLKTAFLGKIGDDMHGLFLKETLENAGIDCSGLIVDKDVFTTLAFVALNDKGERTFSFARKPGADTMLRAQEVREDIVRSSKVFHIGSLSLTNDPSRTAARHALDVAKEAGVTISYDPNYRAPLWNTKEEAMEQMRSVVSYVDVMKISDEETSLLTPEAEPEKAAAWLVENGVPLVAVTLGSEGAFVCVKEDGKVIGRRVAGFQSKVADTTGAGDSFWGGFLYKLIESGKKPADVTLAEAEVFARFGNAVASLCVEKRGGIPAIPKLSEVLERLK